MLNKMLVRCAETAMKLPVAAAWDLMSLGNMGECSSTMNVIRKHKKQAQVDEFIDFLKTLKSITK